LILYRHAPPHLPFLWEVADQPKGRWNRNGEGPVQYLADTPAGAWAELLRHEGITELADLAGVRRAIWAVETHDALQLEVPALPLRTLVGDESTYAQCQGEADRIRDSGADGIETVSAALKAGAAAGWHVDVGIHREAPVDGRVVVVFDRRPNFRGWPVVRSGVPPVEVLDDVRHL
jgi:RES domain